MYPEYGPHFSYYQHIRSRVLHYSTGTESKDTAKQRLSLQTLTLARRKGPRHLHVRIESQQVTRPLP